MFTHALRVARCKQPAGRFSQCLGLPVDLNTYLMGPFSIFFFWVLLYHYNFVATFEWLVYFGEHISKEVCEFSDNFGENQLN